MRQSELHRHGSCIDWASEDLQYCKSEQVTMTEIESISFLALFVNNSIIIFEKHRMHAFHLSVAVARQRRQHEAVRIT